MEIVKAEILWTRRCNLQCSYCNMADGRGNARSRAAWKEGVDNLNQLGCKFIAFYGAEPFCNFENLPEVVGYAESLGIATTVITSGVSHTRGEFFEMLETLYRYGASSLTMSYDYIPVDPSSKFKTQMAIESLGYFKSLGLGVKNIAVVMTVTRHNYKYLPQVIKQNTGLGIWTFFDFIHPDRGQPGSKCGKVDSNLLFQEADLTSVRTILEEVLYLKERGYLAHSSRPFLDFMTEDRCRRLLEYNWNCAREDNFPAWVTIDCDGRVFACDDFQPRGVHEPVFDMTSLAIQWQEFKSYWKTQVDVDCPGCCWNTHIDAHLIKRGELGVEEYVHKS